MRGERLKVRSKGLKKSKELKEASGECLKKVRGERLKKAKL